MTGFQPEKVFIRDDNSGFFPHKMVNHYIKPAYKKNVAMGFWYFLLERCQEGCLMGCSIKGDGHVGELIIDGAPCGLILNHAYAIQDVIDLKVERTKEEFRILRIRNPWGHTEWKNEWSEGTKMFDKYKKELTEYMKALPPDE